MIKNNWVIALFFTIGLTSCKNEKNKIEQINPYDKIGNIMSNCFIKPSDSLFNKKINEIFKIDISFSGKDQITLGALGMFPEVVIVNNKYVIPVDFEPSIPDKESYKNLGSTVVDSIYYKVSTELCRYNNMLFYNDIESTKWIKENDPTALTNLVTDYGYIGNDDWLKFAFYNTDATQNSDDPQLHNLIFDFECLKPMGIGDCSGGKYTLRHDMIDKILEMNFMTYQLFDIVREIKDSPNIYTGDTKKLHLYLMSLCYQLADGEELWYFFDQNKEYFKEFKDYNYFNNDRFKHFIENFEMPKSQGYGMGPFDPDPYIAYGVINDPDGYTNLRDGKGTSAKVIKKIKEGEKFGIETNTGEWWIVVTEDGTRGRIHSSRVTVIKE